MEFTYISWDANQRREHLPTLNVTSPHTWQPDMQRNQGHEAQQQFLEVSGSTTRRTHMVNDNNVVDRSAPIRSDYPNQIPLIADQYAALPQVEVVGHKHNR